MDTPQCIHTLYLNIKKCPPCPAIREKEDICNFRCHPDAPLCVPLSICVLLPVQGVGHRLVDDEQVQSEAPVLDIPDVA